MKKLIYITTVVIAALLVSHFVLSVQKVSRDIYQASQNPPSTGAPGTVVQSLKSMASNVLAPPPLRSNVQNQNTSLTLEGVISQTNLQRSQNGGLPALSENPKLDQSAELKLQDMFKGQYFEHISPAGIGPSDLAKEIGYNYILIGENLALGNFKDDADLLTAWMNSPGHRANILNSKYMEMGAAVGQGMFEAHNTWLAVQEFGKPSSSCPAVDANLKAQIDVLQPEVSQMAADLTAQKKQLDFQKPQSPESDQAYNQAVAAYNSAIAIYNNKVDTLKLVASQYNAQASAYNTCAGL